MICATYFETIWDIFVSIDLLNNTYVSREFKTSSQLYINVTKYNHLPAHRSHAQHRDRIFATQFMHVRRCANHVPMLDSNFYHIANSQDETYRVVNPYFQTLETNYGA